MGASSGKNNLKSKDTKNQRLGKTKTDINILESIKSLHMINEIFSFLNIKKKLDIINYNKQLQEKLGIDIEEYKKISGKYKIGGKNGNIIEYILYTNILIFKGEYLNGKRNGKGKECDNNNLVFEGEYINGKRNGKGKEYSDRGHLEFKGEYLNGVRNGKGKEYYKFITFLFSWKFNPKRGVKSMTSKGH